MDSEHSSCFLCCSTSSLVSGENNWRSRKKTDSLLENQLDVIFILRNLLKVPSIQLERELKACGDNPEDWIDLCDQCIQLTDQARKLYHEIKKIEQHMLERITSSATDNDEHEEGRAYHGNSSKFQWKIRQIVKQNNRHNIFLEGDRLAKVLASKQNPSTAQILLVEKCEVIPKEEIKLEIDEPPSSPASPTFPPMSPAEEDAPVSPSLSESEKSSDSDNDDDEEEQYSLKTKRKSKPRIGGRDRKLKLDPCKCRHCGEQFSDELSVKNHVTLVHGTQKRKYVLCKCPHCDKQFTARKYLHDHVRYVHLKTFTITCPICEKGFVYTAQKYAHMLINHKDDPVTLKLQEELGISLNRCPKGCGSKFLNKDDLDKHIERKHRIDKDPKVFKRSKITEDEKFECGICGKIFFFPMYWSEHQWKAHSAEVINCPVEECLVVISEKGYAFRDHWNLAHKKKKKVDKKQNEGEGSWTCKICGVEISGKRRKFYSHLKVVHKVGVRGRPVVVTSKVKEKKGAEEEKQLILCCLCGKGFRSKTGIDKHTRFFHEKRYTLSCHVCGLKIITRQELNMHLLAVHSEDPISKQLEEVEGLKFSKCQVGGCGAKFLKQDKLDKHVEKMHKGGRDKEKGRFKCRFCGKGFWVRARLRYHESSHEKPGGRLRERDFSFRCGHCGKGYHVKRNLRQHEIHVHNSPKLK